MNNAAVTSHLSDERITTSLLKNDSSCATSGRTAHVSLLSEITREALSFNSGLFVARLQRS